MNQNCTHPSPFYTKFEDATEYNLCFPKDEDGLGPYWLESGQLSVSEGGSQACEKIEAIDLGAGRFRLAYKAQGPFSGLRLNWGDEFMAEVTDRNRLQLLRIATPLAYKHFQLLVPRGFNNESPLAELVHRFEGGWETVASGMLTLIIPSTTATDFEKSARKANLISVYDFN